MKHRMEYQQRKVIARMRSIEKYLHEKKLSEFVDKTKEMHNVSTERCILIESQYRNEKNIIY